MCGDLTVCGGCGGEEERWVSLHNNIAIIVVEHNPARMTSSEVFGGASHLWVEEERSGATDQ